MVFHDYRLEGGNVSIVRGGGDAPDTLVPNSPAVEHILDTPLEPLLATHHLNKLCAQLPAFSCCRCIQGIRSAHDGTPEAER